MNADELRKLKGLLDDGIITQEEFEIKKEELFSQNTQKSTKTKKGGIKVGCLIVIAILAILWAYGRHLGNTDSSKNNTPSSKTTEQTIKKSDLVDTAENIAKTYKENEVNAKEKYEGKIVEISGIVSKIGSSDLDDKDYVLLRGYNGLNVHCYFKKDSGSGIGKLRTGDEVKITGKVYDKFISVLVENCTLN